MTHEETTALRKAIEPLLRVDVLGAAHEAFLSDLGEDLAQVLRLRPMKGTQQYNTDYGQKTTIGLARTVLARISANTYKEEARP